MKYWYKIIPKANVSEKVKQQAQDMDAAVKKCHAMTDIDFEVMVARNYTHGTTERARTDKRNEALGHLALSNHVVEIAYIKEISGVEAPVRTFYFSSNTAMPSKEATYRDAKCTSINASIDIVVPTDPNSRKGKKPGAKPPKRVPKKSSVIYGDKTYRQIAEDLKKSQQAYLKENGKDLREKCSFCGLKGNLNALVKLTDSNKDENKGHMQSRCCNGYCNSSAYTYSKGYNM